ncbi:metal-dependent hydrolase [Acinetobacter larvae]|uniref:Hydrolase n=1 Tax=Acinetobacter larvae TaxID=1789224 RepID=A0A1B2LZ94_9GAMM|nr:metal-dependent hydrolase [Acinetobacter larvae]AOA58093.1 hydrolase [Acinetobacter larvae]
MFIAHLPSGYILAKVLNQKLQQNKISKTVFFTSIMLGSVFPDIDLFYFYFFDGRSVHHHKYFLHWFSLWLIIFFISYLYYKFSKHFAKYAYIVLLFSSAALLHICLDTFVGDVWLFAPFIDKSYVFFEVTPRYQPWWLNFIFHWSFLVELMICSMAIFLYFKNKVQTKP